MNDALLQQLADAGFPVKTDPLDGSKKQEPTIAEFYAQTGKLYTTLTKLGWVSTPDEGIDPEKLKPDDSWQAACAQVFLGQKAQPEEDVLK